ncbi:MAG: hypothetical protein KJN71_00190, partial [Acidimicrobiia bacterium]|nr:hypothetical protein [Acidimicrobiia bacterium]
DLGTLDSLTARVWWGDGTAPEPGIVTQDWSSPVGALEGRNGTVDLSHTYPYPGIYTVTVCVADDDQPDVPVCDSLRMTIVHGFVKMAVFGGAHPEDASGHSPGKVDIHKESMIDGWVGATGEVRLAKGIEVDGSVISVTDRVKVYDTGIIAGDVVAGTVAYVKKHSSVAGDVHAGDRAKVDDDATVGGGIYEGPDASPYPEVTWVDADLPTESKDKVKVKRAPLVLPPATYGDVKVQYGSLELSSGTYRFDDLSTHRADFYVDLDPDGDGVAEPLVVWVRDKLDLEGSMTITSAVGDASGVLFIVGDKAELKKAEAYVGTFLVPDGKARIDKDSTLVGAVYAADVDVEDRVSVTYLPAREAFVEVFVPVIVPGAIPI